MRYSSSEDSAITQQRQVMNLKSHFATVAAIAVLGGYAATALPNANAQLSPNCERNGKRDYCAITPIAGATTGLIQSLSQASLPGLSAWVEVG